LQEDTARVDGVGDQDADLSAELVDAVAGDEAAEDDS
jgi:hypothetical protein